MSLFNAQASEMFSLEGDTGVAGLEPLGEGVLETCDTGFDGPPLTNCFCKMEI